MTEEISTVCQTVVNPWVASVNKAKILASVELTVGNLFVLCQGLFVSWFLVIPFGKIPRG